MTTVTKIGPDGTSELPRTFIDELDSIGGRAPFVIEIREGSLRIRQIDAEQSWFWTPQWQAGEREADEEIRRGEGKLYMGGEEFLRSLDDDARDA